MNLKSKITLVVVLLCSLPLLISAIITNSIASKQASDSLENITEHHLVSLRDVKKRQIEDYFAVIRNQLLNLSSSELVSDALSNMNRASKSYAVETEQLERSTSSVPVKKYYDQQFMSKYDNKNSEAANFSTSDLISKLDANALALQNSFIAKNPAPLGEKHSLVDANDGSQYSYFHSKYHPYFRDFLERFGFYDVFIVDINSGNIVYSVYKELDFATSLIDGAYANTGIGQVFKQVKASTDSSFVSIVDFAPYTPSYEDAASFIAAPIYNNGVKIGALIFQMPIDRINQIMTFDGKWGEAGLGKSGEIYLIGSDMVSRSERRQLIENKENYIESLKNSDSISGDLANLIDIKGTALGLHSVNNQASKTALAGEKGFDFFPDYRGVEVLSAYSPVHISGLNWAIMAEIDKEEAFAASRELASNLWLYGMIILVVMTIISVVIAIIFSSLLAEPILKMSHFITQVKTDLDLTNRLDINSKDEIGEASHSLNSLLHTFQNSMEEVTSASNKIEAAASESSSITKQTSDAIKSQQIETTQVAQAMNNMITTVTEISKNTTLTSSVSDQAFDHVDAGSKAMKSTIDTINELAATMEETSGEIIKLEGYTVDISGVLDVIHGIADQTNLLALNAAIEAARAGEHGRGFAVVADEVRGLAARTQGSIGEITKMVEMLQQGSKNTVQAMEQSQKYVSKTVAQIDATGTALNTISEAINHINEMSTQIAAAAKEQNVMAEDINKNVARINSLTDETADGATRTSDSSKELAQLATGLNTLVHAFKIN